MTHLKREPLTIHYLVYHYAKRFGCGVEVETLVKRNEDWGLFNKMRSTTWKEVNCLGCLEHIYGKKKLELEGIAEKIAVVSIVRPGRGKPGGRLDHAHD